MKLINCNFYRLQQGFLLSATHQLVDKLVSETIDTISLHTSENSGVQRLLEDAENCKQLLPKLQDSVRCEPHPIEIKLTKVTNELTHSVKTYLEVIITIIILYSNSFFLPIFTYFISFIYSSITGNNGDNA